MPDNTLSTLTQIRTKIRRITLKPSSNQISDAELDNYINTAVLYDFPEHLRLFNLRTTLTFYAAPYIDVYDTNTTVTTDPLYNFKNRYITVHPPVYVAGFQALFSQSREEFFNIYPFVNSIASIGSIGDGVTLTFSGFVNNQGPIIPPISGQISPVLQRNVVFSSVDINNNPLTLVDTPISATIGNLSVPNQPPTSLVVQDPLNFINYVTGQFTITFMTAPASGQAINSQTVPYQPARPQAVLFYDTKFTLRPVPDQPYPINLEVFIRPSELLQTNQMPELSEWFQYISYLAAKKIFEDQLDYDSINQIMPSLREQERLILRRTLVQYSNERTATIYSQQTANMYGPGWFWSGGQF